MGRSYQGQDLALGLHIKATKPVADYMAIDTAADRLLPSTWYDTDDGNYYVHPSMITVCKDTGQIFTYIGRPNNPEDIANPLMWTTPGGGGGGSIDPSLLVEVEKRANAYTDTKVQELANTMGGVIVVSLQEYLALKQNNELKPVFYSILQADGTLSRMYFGPSLFAKKAEDGEQITAAVFPLVFPIIFA